MNEKNFGQMEDEGVIGVSVSAFYYLTEPGNLANIDDCSLKFKLNKKLDYGNMDDRLKFENTGESFDDFYVLAGRRGGDIKFFWTLIEDPFYEYPANQFDLNWGCVDFEYFKNVVIDFKNWVLSPH